MNNTGIADQYWEKIVSLFKDVPSIEKVVLFGSRAMGSYRKGSDIDICLEGNLNAGMIPKLLNAYEDLYLPWKLDLILRNQTDNQELIDHIQRVGKILWPV